MSPPTTTGVSSGDGAKTSSAPPTAAGSKSSYASAKQLWQLVTEQSLVASNDVLNRELERNRDFLARGLGWFGQRKKSVAASAPATAKTTGKLGKFVSRLAEMLGVEEDSKARGILSAYLAGDFRGTKQSLRKLVDDERLQRPLMVDVWQFYRAERLYLLQVLKELLTHSCNCSHRHRAQFASVLDALDAGEGALGKSLLKQLETSLSESPPPPASKETSFCAHSWARFSLREQSELLQINLIYLHSRGTPGGEDKLEAFKKYFSLFQEHGFGHKQQSSSHLLTSLNDDLVESVGMLETLILIYLVDLPSLTSSSSQSGAKLPLGDAREAAKVDRLVAGLGSCAEHGPVMLAWMLARYLSDADSDSLSKHQTLGERSIQLRAVSFLMRVVTNSVISSHFNVWGIARGTCYALLAVLASSFDLQQMGLALDALDLTMELTKSEPVANDFWRQGLDVGLGTSFASLVSSFPMDLRPFSCLCRSLSLAGSSSATRVLRFLESMPVFVEHVGEVSQAVVIKTPAADGVSERWQLRTTRHPCPEADQSFAVPLGTVGLVDRRSPHLVRWQFTFNSFRYLFGEMDVLTRQISLGAKNISQETLANVTEVTSLVKALMKHSGDALKSLADFVTRSIFTLVDRASHLAQPPLTLLANCLGILTVLANDRPQQVWEKLSESGLFPHFTGRGGLLRARRAGESDPASAAQADDCDDLSPGLVGSLLAQQECVSGEYPLTTAFLDLLLTCVVKNHGGGGGDRAHPATASVVYVARDMFASYRQWRFVDPVEREVFGQKILALFKAFLREDDGDKSRGLTRKTLCRSLIAPAPLQALLQLVGTGDRPIRALLESQSSWESGVGVELSRLVNVAIVVFDRLLVLSSADVSSSSRLEEISELLCSPPASGPRQEHFLLTLAHYIYHSHSCELPVSAMHLLGTVARMFPMSLLACLGGEAEAVRDILVYRLESQTEDASLKVAIVDLFSACVNSQPGFIQLLIGIKQDVHVVGDKKPLAKNEEAKNVAVQLVSEQGCLRIVLQLLDTVTSAASEDGDKFEELHLSLVNFVLNLWQHQHILAMSHLRKQPEFWNRLSWSLFDEKGIKRFIVNSRIFRILANEIYTFGGHLDKGLLAVLEKFCDEKGSHLIGWNKRVLSRVQSSAPMETDASYLPEPKKKEESVSLLSAWKAFLVVLSKDQPVPISPQQCHQVSSGLVQVIEDHLSDLDSDPRVLTSLAEMCLMLMRRWQTKCAGADMRQWLTRVAALLRTFSSPSSFPWEALPARARAAVLGVAATALRASSHFRLEGQSEALGAWLDPAALTIQKAFRLSETSKGKQDGPQEEHFGVLAVDLLRNLVQRIKEPTEWYPPFHYHVLSQTLMSKLSQCLTAEKHPELCQSILGLLSLVARAQQGLDAVLSSDLSQLLWLPLSDVGKRGSVGKEWTQVFRLAVNLSSYLQVQGGQMALQGTLDTLVLLQDRLTVSMTLPRALLNGTEETRLMVDALSLIAHFMSRYKQWQVMHPSSLAHYYQILCANLYQSTCLLLRPATLSQMLTKQQHPSQSKDATSSSTSSSAAALERVRRLSSTDQELEVANVGLPPEVALAQASLLESASAALSALLSLSPRLEDLSAGDTVDPQEFQQLLGIGFTSPSFEQEDGLTYGTLTSLSNFCIRSLSRMGGGGVGSLSEAGGNRTPSPITPSKSPVPPPSTSSAAAATTTRLAPPPSTTGTGSSSTAGGVIGGLERKRLVLVLEKSMTLMLVQSMLYFSDESYSTRDKQFLRRELGAEFGSFSESIRRYISGTHYYHHHHHHRGPRLESTPSPQGGAGGGGVGPPRSPGAASQASSSRSAPSGAGKSEEQFMKMVNSLVQVVFK